MPKLKMLLCPAVFAVLSLLFAQSNLASPISALQKNQHRPDLNGTLQKMIVENGSVTIQLDLNGLNGSGSLVARPVTLRFASAANSFFPILVFNNLLRGIEPGSMRLVSARLFFSRR